SIYPVWLHVRPEHETGIRHRIRKEHLALEDKVSELLLGHEKELPVSHQMDLAILDGRRAPLIRVVPSLQRLPIEERAPLGIGCAGGLIGRRTAGTGGQGCRSERCDGKGDDLSHRQELEKMCS